jgi:protein LTV1
MCQLGPSSTVHSLTFVDTVLCQTLSKYEQPSAEYSENNSDDERLCGVDNLDQFNDVFDEFLKSHRKHSTNDELFAKDKSLVLHPTDDNNENENETDSSDIDNVDRELEELFLAQDGDDDDVQQYDCESILSTYSNTENHPALICEEEVPTRKIQLNRYGIPKHVLNKSQHSQMTSNDSTTSTTEQEKKKVNLGQARPRHENPNERHNRKQQLKQERRTKRALKKALKMTYKNEEQQQQRQRNSGVLQSKKVMRY